MKTRQQIEEEYRLKESNLRKERGEEIMDNQEKRATIRKPIDEEYWAKRDLLDAEWKDKLQAAGVN